MPLLLADFTHARDCKLNLRKNVDTTLNCASMIIVPPKKSGYKDDTRRNQNGSALYF